MCRDKSPPAVGNRQAVRNNSIERHHFRFAPTPAAVMGNKGKNFRLARGFVGVFRDSVNQNIEKTIRKEADSRTVIIIIAFAGIFGKRT